MCLSKNNHSSHLAQQVARAFVDVSFTTEHHFTFHSFHLHSYPTFYATVNQTFMGVTFTRMSPIRRICLSVLWLKRTRPQNRPSRPPGSKWSCVLLRIVLQDALREVTKIYLRWNWGFCGWHHGNLDVKNREVAETAKKVMKKLKEEVETKGTKLSVTENGKEGKSKMIASCDFL